MAVLLASGALLCGATMLACSSTEITGARELTFSLSADRSSVPVGDSVVFTFDATGASLRGVVLEYGDGAVDSVQAFGAQTAGGRRAHTYQSAGTFVVMGRAEDATAEAATDEVTVTVMP